MTDAAADKSVGKGGDQTETDGAFQADPPPGRLRFVIIGAVVLLIFVGAGVGAYFSGIFGGSPGVEGEAAPDHQIKVIFYDLPEMIVNLVSNSKKPVYLKVRLSLELGENEDIPALEGFMPRVIDQFQVFLRGLRLDDLNGSAGIYRVREGLLRRAGIAAYPVVIRDVLFKEMLIQ